MGQLALMGNALARALLLPGDLACNVFGLSRANNRDLVRMLVNSLVYFLVGLGVAVMIV